MLRRLALRSSSAASLRSQPGALNAAIPGRFGGHQSTAIPSSVRRFLDIHQLGNKESIQKERARLNDELNRGYFADIKEFNAHGGKVAVANKILIPSVSAVKFPELKINFSDGRSMELPFDSKWERNFDASVSLVCLSFRASSQSMNESWSVPLSDAFKTSENVQIYEVSFIDSWILALGPIKKLMLQVMKKSKDPLRQTAYSFGDHYYFRKKLNIVNLLTGYVFLLDSYGRIRWQGFGFATKEEVSSLISCAQLLIGQK